jgi:hypothetical protein
VPNELIAGLGVAARNSLIARGEIAQLTFAKVLGEAGNPVRHAPALIQAASTAGSSRSYSFFTTA